MDSTKDGLPPAVRLASSPRRTNWTVRNPEPNGNEHGGMDEKDASDVNEKGSSIVKSEE